MKDGLTSVDVAALASELAALLVGGRLEKAYQPAKRMILLRMRAKGHGRADLLFDLGRFLTVVARAPTNPDQPSMLATTLRHELGNARITAVAQVGFDRILRIDLERGDGRRALVFELFGEGNLLLLDENDVILLPMRGEEFRARRLRKGEPYLPPPAGPHPLRLDGAALADAGRAARRDLVRFLALDLGLGPLWAEEICARAGIPKSALPPQMEEDAWGNVAAALQALAADLARNDLAPVVVHDGDQPIDAVPFPLAVYEGRPVEEHATFYGALDAFFQGDAQEEAEDPRQALFEAARAKIGRQVEQMDEALARFAEEEKGSRACGEALYLHYEDVTGRLAAIQAAHAKGGWDAVLAGAAAWGIKDIRPHEGTAVLTLAGDGGPLDVRVDVRKGLEQNADDWYAQAKRSKVRAEGATKARGEALVRIAELEAKGLDGFGAAPKVEAARRHFWFESYRFTVTPGGLIAVGGRSAQQNDAVVKKYLRDGDRYVHAEIHGAPSVVVRHVDKQGDVPEEDVVAACHFAACSSRAWRQFGEASAYWVTAQQVSKTPRSGEFVPRGAWIVHGRRNIVDGVPMRWLVGRVRFGPDGVPGRDKPIEKLVGGPPAALASWVDEPIEMEPGEVQPGEAALLIAKRYGVSVEEAQAVLPPGGVRFRGEP